MVIKSVATIAISFFMIIDFVVISLKQEIFLIVVYYFKVISRNVYIYA